MKEDTHLVSLIVLFFIGWVIGSILEERYQAIRITDLITATATFAAALAAWYSAKFAKEASNHAQEVEFRELLRDLNRTLQNIIAEHLSVDNLANKLIRNYREIAIHSGQENGTRVNAHIAEVEKKQTRIIPLQQKAVAMLEKQNNLRLKSEKELTDLLIKYDGYLTQIYRIKESIEDDLTSVEIENQAYREQVIAKNK